MHVLNELRIELWNDNLHKSLRGKQAQYIPWSWGLPPDLFIRCVMRIDHSGLFSLISQCARTERERKGIQIVKIPCTFERTIPRHFDMIPFSGRRGESSNCKSTSRSRRERPDPAPLGRPAWSWPTEQWLWNRSSSKTSERLQRTGIRMDHSVPRQLLYRTWGGAC